MIKAGITGGIGSGKSIICRVFQSLGIQVYYADLEAKKLYETSNTIKQKMIALLGNDIYKDNKIDRKKLASVIFSDKKMLRSVNEVIHPEVTAHFKQWCETRQFEKYVVLESALLFESRHSDLMNVIVTVTAPVEIRLSRLLEREGMSPQTASSIMNNQLSDDLRISKSDYIIINDDSHLILPEVLELHRILSNMGT